MRDFGKCERAESGQVITREERSRKFCLVNPRRAKVRVIEVDGCFIAEGLRCDWLFLPTEDQLEIYVELKGSDIRHAIRQIEETIPQVSEDVRTRAKWCYVISGGGHHPSIKTYIQKAKARFRGAYKAQLKTTSQGIATHTLG